MKLKVLAVILLTLLISSAGLSQTRFSLGLEAGINIANVNVTPSTSTSGRTGLIIGGIADIGFTPQLGIVTGIRYVMKGYSNTFTNQGGVSQTDNVKLNFIEFPALFKVKFPLTEVKPYLIGGPTLGISVSSTVESTAGTQSATSDVSSSVESIDFGLLFGAGLDFNIGPKMDLFAQGGYSLGLSNILKGNTTATIKNYGIQLTGGVKFKL
jgi:opacity protein-like surface antigen